MTLKTRRILLIICIIFFFILSPIIILYTFGFRYDFKERKIIQTGIIYIMPVPYDGIKVFINGEEEKNNLSIKGILKKDYVVYNLLPQAYRIKISKNGYWDWEKNLVVLPGAITYAQPLLLPRDPAVSAVLTDKNAAAWSFSPDFKKIAYLNGEGAEASINIYDLNLKKTITAKITGMLPTISPAGNAIRLPAEALEFDVSSAKISWSPNSENFAVAYGVTRSRIILLGAKEKEIAYLNGVSIPSAIIRGEWNGESDSFIYSAADQNLYSLNAKSSSVVALANGIAGFAAANNDIYFLEKASSFVYRFKFSDPDKKTQVSFKPLKSDAESENETEKNADGISEFFISPKGSIAVVTPGKNLFFLGENGLPIYIGSGVESAKFSKTGDSLLYNSAFEIFIYSPENDLKKLVTRAAKKIGDVDWHRDYNHIWFSTNGILKNIELDSRPIPNTFDFLPITEKSSGFIFDNTAGNIYYAEISGEKLSIYRVSQ